MSEAMLSLNNIALSSHHIKQVSISSLSFLQKLPVVVRAVLYLFVPEKLRFFQQ